MDVKALRRVGGTTIFLEECLQCFEKFSSWSSGPSRNFTRSILVASSDTPTKAAMPSSFRQ